MHKCACCPKIADKDSRCSSCAEKQRVISRAFVSRRKAAKICLQCKLPAIRGQRCAAHADEHREYTRRYRAKPLELSMWEISG